LDRFVQADDRTAQMMMENDKNVKRVRNNMNDEYSKKLEELYSKKAQLERESDSSQKRLVSQLSSLYKQEIKEAEDKEKAKAEDEKRMKQASVKLEIELEKIKNAELLKEREKFAADMISQLTEEIDSQFETFAKEDEYEKNRQLINSQNRLAIQESEVQNQWDLKQMQLDNDREMELSAAEKTGASVLLINEKYANYQKILDSEVADAKLKIYSDFAGSIASLFGEQTAIGRIAAVTQTAINTYVAAMSVYKDTPGGIIIRSLAAATAVLTGLSTIKKILEVKSGLPGDSGASMQNVIISNPITQRNFASTIPSSAITQAQLTQGQLNAIPNQQNLLTAQDIANAIKNLPNPVVTVEDINAKVKSVNKVTVRGTI
jgi:hypothetical protein